MVDRVDDRHVIPVTAATFDATQARRMVEANIAANDEDADAVFPQGVARFVNNRALTGVPFFIVSPWLERRQEAQVFPSGKSYPAHQVVQVMIRTLDPVSYESYDAEQATLTGEYLLNQFRNATEHELLNAGPWTLRYHPHLTLAKYGKPDLRPLMLARYDPRRDQSLAADEYDDAGSVVAVDRHAAAPPRRSSAFDLEGNTTPVELDGYPFAAMLAKRNMNEADFLNMVGWDSLRGHTPHALTAAFTLIDKALALGNVDTVDGLVPTNEAKTTRTRR